MIDLLSKPNAVPVLAILRGIGGRASYIALLAVTKLGAELSLVLQLLKARGLVSETLGRGGHPPKEFCLTESGGQFLDVMDAWHQRVHDWPTPVATAFDEGMEGLIFWQGDLNLQHPEVDGGGASETAAASNAYEHLVMTYAKQVGGDVDWYLGEFRDWLDEPKEDVLFYAGEHALLLCTKHDEGVFVRLAEKYAEAARPSAIRGAR